MKDRIFFALFPASSKRFCLKKNTPWDPHRKARKLAKTVNISLYVIRQHKNFPLAPIFIVMGMKEDIVTSLSRCQHPLEHEEAGLAHALQALGGRWL
jgi:hypothetical protein